MSTSSAAVDGVEGGSTTSAGGGKLICVFNLPLPLLDTPIVLEVAASDVEVAADGKDDADALEAADAPVVVLRRWASNPLSRAA